MEKSTYRQLELPSSTQAEQLGLYPGVVPLGKRQRRGKTPSYTGVFASTKCLGLPIFDSLLERDFHTVLCTDPRVAAYAMQSHKLAYWTPQIDGTPIQRTYTPDFVIRLRDQRLAVIEVKSRAFVRSRYWIEREPFIRNAYAEDFALEFLVLTERQIRIQPRLDNLRCILRYGSRLADHEAEMKVRDTLRRSDAPAVIGAICEATALSSDHGERAYSALMRLHMKGEISLDLHVPLSASTKIHNRRHDD